MTDSKSKNGLRVVTFNVLPPAFGMVASWAQEAGHKLVLVVTTPGPTTRRTPSYREVVAMAPPNVDVLVTTRLRRVATPLLRELRPDLIVSFTFPYRLPPELRQTARYGAVNLHPAALPAYRGPNVLRQFYEGAPLIGATLHWTEDDFDTGRILSQHTAPLPEPVTAETIMAVWLPLMTRAFAEGVERALAGEPGTAQDHTKSSYAAPFTEAEDWLDWREPGRTLQRKATALNLFGPARAKARVAAEVWRINKVEPLPEQRAAAAPGAVVETLADGLIVAVGDGAVRVSATRLEGEQEHAPDQSADHRAADSGYSSGQLR